VLSLCDDHYTVLANIGCNNCCTVLLHVQNVTVQSQSTSDVRFLMTLIPSFSSSTMLRTTDTTTAVEVTSDVGDMADWTTQVVNVTSSVIASAVTTSSGSQWPWSSTTAATEMTEFDVTTRSFSPTLTNSSVEDEVDSSHQVDVAYQRLTNLAVVIAVYSAVLVSMIVLVCRRRRFGFDYQRAGDWTDLDVCSGGNNDDDGVDDSAAFKRYWDTRRDLAERQRLLNSLRVDNISSVAAGHLIDRLPEDVV